MVVAEGWKKFYFDRCSTKKLLEHMKQEGSKRGTTGTLREVVLAHSESFQHSSLCKDYLNLLN